MSTVSKLPTYRGFDYFYGFYSGFIDYYDKTIDGIVDLHEDESLVTDENALDANVFTAHIYNEKVDAVLKQHSQQYADVPMFLMYSSQLIHFPWTAPEEFVARCREEGADEETAMYCGMNLVLDEAFANVTCMLEKYELASNTVVVVLSDNGGEPTMPGNNYPFRGSKNTVFRGGSSVPAFLFGDRVPEELRGTSYNGQLHVTGTSTWKRTKERLFVSLSCACVVVFLTATCFLSSVVQIGCRR
jgi:arylsulfatase A-like enzyme